MSKSAQSDTPDRLALPPLTAKQRAAALLIIWRMELRLAAFETLINAQTGKAVRA